MFRQINAGIKSQNLPNNLKKKINPMKQLAKHKNKAKLNNLCIQLLPTLTLITPLNIQ